MKMVESQILKILPRCPICNRHPKLITDEGLCPGTPYLVTCGSADAFQTFWDETVEKAMSRWCNRVAEFVANNPEYEPKECEKEMRITNDEKKEDGRMENNKLQPKDEPINKPSKMTWDLANRQIRAKKAIIEYLTELCKRNYNYCVKLNQYIVKHADSELSFIGVGLITTFDSINSLIPVLSTLLGIDEENTENAPEKTDSP